MHVTYNPLIRSDEGLTLETSDGGITYFINWIIPFYCEIFKHEFVMLIWLPEQGFQLNTYKHNAVYIPARVFENSGYCYCNLEKADPADSKCTFCSDPLMDVIQNSIDQGKVLSQMT